VWAVSSGEEHLTFNQGVVGSNPTRLTTDIDPPPRRTSTSAEGHLIRNEVAPSSIHRPSLVISFQREDIALMTLSEALTAYRICAKAEGKSARTIDWVTDSVRYFAAFAGDIPPEKLTASHLRQFIIALQQKRAFSSHPYTKAQDRALSPETVASYVRAIKSFFSSLQHEELITDNPMAKVKLPKVPRRVMPTFDERDLKKLMEQPDKKTDEGFRDYAIMATLIDTGIRVSELCQLSISDVDLDSSCLRVMGKGRKERLVPIGYRLTKVLLKYKVAHRPGSGSGSFFLTRDGRPMSKKRVEVIIKKRGTKAGIKARCSPHTFRSTSAVLYLRNGGDPFSLQKKLGHSTLVMTRRYSELADADVKARHLKASPFDRLNL